MPRFRLLLAYDGAPFAGWQRQPGFETVQGRLEEALGRILKTEGIRVHGSGRTDTGVHALGQVAHFDVPEGSQLSAGHWERALNMNLPPSIRVLDCQPAAADFHARFDALGKTYRYRIHTGEVLMPFEAGRALHQWKFLDDSLLAEACHSLEGTHDFAGFAAFRGNEDGSENTVRDLWKVEAVREGDLIRVDFHGNGFLYKMVRLLMGAILRVGSGRVPLNWLTDLLHRRVPGKCQHLAPADGLYLLSVDYPERPDPHDSDTSRATPG